MRQRRIRGTTRELDQAARDMRKPLTDAEGVLWQELRRGRLGYHFRRQHAVTRFILDFYCPARRLVVEVDGGYHQSEEQRARDALRTGELERLGMTVLRFTNDEVMTDLASVLHRIADTLGPPPGAPETG
jgi:very-short-patch-repair endonuclease